MLKKFLNYIMHQRSKLFPVLISISSLPVYPCDGPDTEMTKLNISDGIKLTAVRTGNLSFDVRLLIHKKIIWYKRFYDPEAKWQYTYFIRVKGNNYIYDINNDGYPEVAIAPYEGGNSPYRTVEIYSVRENSLEFFESKRANIFCQGPAYH